MAGENKSWLWRRVEGAVRGGLTRAYETVKVDPAGFLLQLRIAYDLPIATIPGVYTLEIDQLDRVADSVIRSGMKLAALEGAGLGLGGIITIVPDLGILSAITMRTIQKLSLLYGFEMNTDDEIAELWIAAASAAGVDISRELVEREVVKRFVPKVIQRIAARATTEIVEKWAGRLVPGHPPLAVAQDHTVVFDDGVVDGGLRKRDVDFGLGLKLFRDGDRRPLCDRIPRDDSGGTGGRCPGHQR